MKILFYQNLPSINSTLLTWTLCEELRLRGHLVHYGKPNLEAGKSIGYDWVHGAGTDAPEALFYAREIGAKCHIHLEGVAHWRIGYENAVDWGYDRNHTQDEINAYTQNYKAWMYAAYEADSCTVNGDKQIQMIEWMFGEKLPNCFTMCCGADDRFALTLPNYPKLNCMITLSRLEYNKHVFMIAEALSILVNEGFNLPIWLIIGYGSEEQYKRLNEICNRNKIAFNIHACFGAEKWYWIKRSKLMLCGLMMWIPMSEGILCQIPVLAFDDIEVHSMYEDTVWWASRNNIEDYAKKIKWILNKENQKEIESKNLYAMDRLLDLNRHGKNEFYANTQTRAAAQYEKIFMKGNCKQ